jgi:catechol 2,3-dioxygenase-like lactoylglutathione lyase family enzyme
MRYNKHYIAELLAQSAAADPASAKTRQQGERPALTQQGFPASQKRDLAETAKEPSVDSELRHQSQNPATRFIIGGTLLWVILTLFYPAASLAQQSLHAAGGRYGLGEHHIAQSTSAAPRPSLVIHAVDAVGITVADADRAIAFYSNVLAFEKVSDVEVTGEQFEHLQGVFGVRMRIVRLKLGDEFIELTEYLAPRGRPIPVDSRSNDRWFQHIAIITSDMDRAYLWLRKNKVEHASSGPQRLPDWNKNAGGIKAFYFKDPEGHVLEILQFPEGKGDAKWHTPSDKLFLGIDHTAIVVGETEASLKFYRDALGLKIVGESENYGTEQEHLNNVFGARLKITSLHATRGPGIELLEYLAPSDGRPYPKEARSNDLYSWQTKLVVPDASQAALLLRERKYRFVSSGVVAISAAEMGLQKSFLVRDPDGHLLQLIER